MGILSRLSCRRHATLKAFVAAAAALAASLACAAPVRVIGEIDHDNFIHENSGRPLKDLLKDARRARTGERYDSAAAYYSMAASLYSESLSERDIRRCAIANANLAYIWLAEHSSTAEAYPWLMKAKELASRHGMKDIETNITSSLGHIHFDYNNFSKASELLKKVLLEVMEQRTDEYYGMAMADFVAAAMFDGGKTLDRETALKMREHRPSPEMPLSRYSAALAEAAVRYAGGDPGGAARILSRPGNLPDITTDRPRYLIMHALILGKMLMGSGRYAEAAETVGGATGLCSQKGYYSLLEKCYTVITECAERLGDPRAAQRFRYRTLEIRDSLFNASKYGTIKELEAAEALKRLNENVKTATLEAKRQRQVTLISLCAGTVLLGLLVWLYISRSRLMNAYAEIYKRNVELTRRHIIRPETTADPEGASTDEKEDSAEEADRMLMHGITAFMDGSPDIYHPDFSLEALAEAVGSRPKAVSRAINSTAGKNFNALLSEYRVRKACGMLADTEAMRTMTIETVAEKAGYRSRTHFSKVFKTVTGLTPAQFSKQTRMAEGSRNQLTDN